MALLNEEESLNAIHPHTTYFSKEVGTKVN
jgi:hypothetical protein